ncbi:hypothetical protein DFH06DRAFT_1316989 [Mycena polygramma]|nr:hypothetical protein DFH06DRAFT_1316989 [Mycena polygramma]
MPSHPPLYPAPSSHVLHTDTRPRGPSSTGLRIANDVVCASRHCPGASNALFLPLRASRLRHSASPPSYDLFAFLSAASRSASTSHCNLLLATLATHYLVPKCIILIVLE